MSRAKQEKTVIKHIGKGSSMELAVVHVGPGYPSTVRNRDKINIIMELTVVYAALSKEKETKK